MAKPQIAPAVSEPEPQPGSDVETQLAQIEGQPGEGQTGSEVENQLAQIEGRQQQGGDSYTAFTQAAKQELDPQYQAFKAASAKQLEQIAEPLTPAEHPGEPELSWWDPRRLLPGLVAPGTYEALRFAQSQFATSAYQQAEVTGGKMVQGVLGEAGNVLNPAAKYSDQNNAQLQDGISKAQAEIDNLAKEQTGAVDEFSVENAGMRIGQLHGDIAAMQKQLASRTPGGQAEPPSLLEQAGSKMLQGAGGIQHDIDVLMGRKPPESPTTWLQRMMTQEPGVPENPVFEATLPGAIARTTGQVAPFVALSELGTVPELLGFAGAQYHGDVDAALAAHKDLATADKAGQLASLFAPVQMMGFKAVLGPFLSGDAGRTVGEVLKNTLKNAAIGAGVGASQQLWENTTAVLSGIDPDRKWSQGLGDSIAQQAATMTVLGLATETPSFALRSLSNPRIDAYKAPGGPEAQPETAPAPGEHRERRTAPGSYFESKPTERVLKRFGPIGTAIGKTVDTPYIYTHRMISALHNMIYSGFGRATELMAATEFARTSHDLSQEKALDWAHTVLNGNDGQIKAFNEEADNEGLSGTVKQLRVQELIDQHVPQEIRDQADMWGTRANAYQDPHGLLGAVSSAVTRLAHEYPAMAQFVPIVRIPTNLINTAIDLTPIGFARYWNAESYLTRGGKLDLSADQVEQLKGQLLAKAIAGTGLLVAGMVATSIRKPDGSFVVNVHGAGPVDRNEKYQLMDQGWQPYSIQFGNTYIPYEAFPAWLGLAMIGNFQDSQRYQDMPPGVEAASYMMGRSMSAFLDKSFVRGLSDLTELLKQVGDQPEKTAPMERYLATIGKSFIPVAGMGAWKQLYQQFLNDKLYRAKGFAAIARDLPFAADPAGLKPVINGLGEPVHLAPLTHRFWSTGISDRVWEFLDQHQLTISSPNVRKILNQAPTEEQKYNFSVFRGQHMRELLSTQMDRLNAIKDPDELDKAFRRVEEQASRLGVRDIIIGKPVPAF
jgi:hypothetical protein